MLLSAVLDLNPVWEPGPLKMQLLAAAYCQKLNCHNNEENTLLPNVFDMCQCFGDKDAQWPVKMGDVH